MKLLDSIFSSILIPIINLNLLLCILFVIIAFYIENHMPWVIFIAILDPIIITPILLIATLISLKVKIPKIIHRNIFYRIINIFCLIPSVYWLYSVIKHMIAAV